MKNLQQARSTLGEPNKIDYDIMMKNDIIQDY